MEILSNAFIVKRSVDSDENEIVDGEEASDPVEGQLIKSIFNSKCNSGRLRKIIEGVKMRINDDISDLR